MTLLATSASDFYPVLAAGDRLTEYAPVLMMLIFAMLFGPRTSSSRSCWARRAVRTP